MSNYSYQFTYEEAIHTIDSLGKYGAHPGSENATMLLEKLGHPEKDLKIIHVAGTNGKGSVCSYLADMLNACGYRTGLFISPHLVDLCERIQINRIPVDHAVFTKAFNKVWAAVKELEQENYIGITYFDCIFAAGMLIFAEAQVDYLINETGLGGLYDSTNAITKPLLTIITSISFDHTEILGKTLADIATQKAGIIKSGVPLIFCADEPEVEEVMREHCAQKGAVCLGISRRDCEIRSVAPQELKFRFYVPESDMIIENVFEYLYQSTAITHSNDEVASVDLSNSDNPSIFSAQNFSSDLRYYDLTLHTGALYQAENSSIALAAASYILGSEFQTKYAAILQALSVSFWEGRLEELRDNIYLDGAHNEDGCHMLLDSIRALYPNGGGILLFTAVKEKDTVPMIRAICESGLFLHYILTTLTYNSRAIPAETLKETFREFTDAPIEIYEDSAEGFRRGTELYDTSEDYRFFLTAGSLYLLGNIKETLE